MIPQPLKSVPDRHTILLIAIFLIASGHLFGENRYLIRGRVKATNTKQTLAIPIALVEIRMEEKPIIKPIQKTVADTKGIFSFTLAETHEGVFYRVSTVIKGQVMGSNPVRFSDNSKIIDLVLELPEVTEGLEKLSFTKNILVFDLLEDYVQITDIIDIENRTTSTIDATKNAFSRTLPQQATEIKIIDTPPGVRVESINGGVRYKLILSPGRHQLYMTYKLPLSGNSLKLLNYIPPSTKQVELIVPTNSIQVDFDQPNSPVSSVERSWNNQVFDVKSIDIGDEVTTVNITISDLPLAPKKLFYPAIILLIFLLSGLFWYLKNSLHKNGE